MKQFKIDIWHNDGLEIEFYTLFNEQMEDMMQQIIQRINLCCTDLFNNYFFKIAIKAFSSHIQVPNLDDEDGLEITLALQDCPIKYGTSIYLIWDRNNIDMMDIEVLLKKWDYIWYGPSDEVCLLYYPYYNWVLLITDYGVVYCM